MPETPETGRFRIYTPHTYQTWGTNKIEVRWKPLREEYPTRQKAIDEMNRQFKRGDAKIRKVPDFKPLTEKQQCMMAHITNIGYDSAYNTMRMGGYSWSPKTVSGVCRTNYLKNRGFVAYKVGINPHRGGKATCTVVALPWIIKYHDRFATWPSPELIKEMGTAYATNK